MDLNTILIILGVLALVALVAHGLWSNHREKSKYFKNSTTFNRTFTQEQHSREQQTLSESVIQDTPSSEVTQKVQQQSFEPQQSISPVDYRETERTVDDIKISIPNVEPAPEPVRVEYEMNPAAPKQNPADMTLEQLETQSQINDFEGINSSSPELREQLSKMSLGELDEVKSTVHFNEARTQDVNTEKQTSGYIQLYVVSPQYREFNGLKLIQCLENLGFIFGDHNMYHRHFDLSVVSPTLFSVANLQDNGSFNPYNTEFSTIGIVLFMKLPSPGSDLANLKLMIRAAKTLAEDLGGTVLTEDEKIFDDCQEQRYLACV
ncbi:cell division protein ZipA [Rodentibacter pneumotropicus]|uniref:cell division protein ZipA n=1 Tax=Rodentibacter pneumotropicus TaxID=758 RepID=UPI00098701CA|nr:cell division protein ZipA [Rodentibacter pneumotropicus]OOF61604.1 cell division protein ZipA [Rodentibacter pneumotropicus]THA18663.1 cell division protein ZipA [Rodentibacter pneumotropicus]